MTSRPAAFSVFSSRLLLVGCAVVIGASLLPGCFLGRPYDDFRAYYNTFYNAEQAYEAGLEQVTREDDPIDRDRYIAIFPAPEIGRGGSIREFDDAVEKAAAILRDRSSTRYADDALLLIGKAYFYQENVVGAERKFNEAIAVAAERGDDNQADEARLWLGRTFAAARRYDEAAETLRLAVQREGVGRRWEAQMQLALGDLFVRAGRFEEAAEALEAGLARAPKDDVGARAQFLLGQTYETLGRYDEAAAAYAGVGRYKPLYELGYAAQLSEALVLGLRADRTDDGLDRLRRMSRDDKNFDNLAEVEVARARLLIAAGQPADARDLLLDRLYSRTRPASGPARTQAYYRLAEVYREGFRDYVRASTYLDTAATSFRPLARDVRLTPDAMRDVEKEATAYATFADVARRVAAFDSLLYLGSLDDEAYSAAIDRIRQDLVAERKREQEELRRLETAGGFGRGGAVGGLTGANAGTGRDDDEGIGQPSIGRSPGGIGGAEDGFLGYRNPSRVQQSLVSFRLIWGNRPLAPNWRRAAAVGAISDVGDGRSTDPFERAAGRDAFDVVVDDSDVPRTELARAALRTERAAARYELGNRLFLQLGLADSAAAWFTTVLDQDAESAVALRARYALAEVRREQGRAAEAETLYRRLLAEAEPGSGLGRQVRERLGMPEEPLSADTSALAGAAYAEASRTWRAGRYAEALEGLFSVEAAYPGTDAAPRALLAAGLAYTEWAQQDTLDAVGLFDPMPVRRRAVPDSVRFDLDALYAALQTDYRGTPYARRATALQAALDERRPIPVADSLAADSTAFAGSDVFPDSLGADRSLPVDSAALALTGTDELGLGDPDDEEANAEQEGEEDADRDIFQEQADQAVDAALSAMPTLDEAGPPGDRITDDDPEAVAKRFDQTDLIGDRPLDASLGGFSWQIAVSESREQIETVRRAYRGQRFRTALYSVNLEDGPGFGLLVGQFLTAPEARAALGLLRSSGDANFTLVGIGDLQLLDEEVEEDGDD